MLLVQRTERRHRKKGQNSLSASSRRRTSSRRRRIYSRRLWGRGGLAGDTASYQDWMCPLVKNVLAAAEISCRRHQLLMLFIGLEWICLVALRTTKPGDCTYIHPLPKVIYPKYSKHWLYTVAHTIDCVYSKMLNHGLNHGFFLSRFKLIPCPIHWTVYVLAYLNII